MVEFYWTNKVDGVDEIKAEDVNNLGNTIINIISDIESFKTFITNSKEDVSNKGKPGGYAPLNSAGVLGEEYLIIDWNPINGSTNPIASGGVYDIVGNIETALDGIIAIQESLIGGAV